MEKIDCLEVEHQNQYRIWQAEKESLNNRIRNNFEVNKNLNQKHQSHLQKEASKLTNLKKESLLKEAKLEKKLTNFKKECLQKEAKLEKNIFQMCQNVLEIQEKCDVHVNQTKFLQTENESLETSLEAIKKHCSKLKQEKDVVVEKLRENDSLLNSVMKKGEKSLAALHQEKSQLEEKLRITNLEGQNYVGQLMKQFEVDCKQYQKDISDLKLKNSHLELRIEELSKHQNWSKQILQSIE